MYISKSKCSMEEVSGIQTDPNPTDYFVLFFDKILLQYCYNKCVPEHMG